MPVSEVPRDMSVVPPMPEEPPDMPLSDIPPPIPVSDMPRSEDMPLSDIPPL
jgi:hypothetical protein